MALQVMADNDEIISTARDAALYNALTGGKDFVIGDIGGELKLTYQSASFIVSMATGECVICGRHVYNDAPLTVTLNASDTGYIVLRYNLSETAANICKLMAVNSTYTDNINGTGVIHDIILASYVTNTSGVSSLKDLRDIVDSMVNGAKFKVTHDTNGNTLSTPIEFEIVKV